MPLLIFLLLSFAIICCNENSATTAQQQPGSRFESDSLIGQLDLPAGYHRVAQAAGAFGEWLRQIKLKKDHLVHLYNGRLKSNQDAQFAVLDVSVGNKDLQQCADAVMRLRAEYFYQKNQDDSIVFHTGDGTAISFSRWMTGTRYKASGERLVGYETGQPAGKRENEFRRYLDLVFTYCGTYSLAKELKPVNDLNKMRPGDVFIKPGFPGHAMIIVDVAENNQGEKLFLLAQSYMPAQEIHIVKNLSDGLVNPWYHPATVIDTPEWTFEKNQLRTWN